MNKKLLLIASGKVLGLNSISKIVGIGVKVIVSRFFGPAGLGIYELVRALSRMGSVLGLLGLNQTAVYYISRFQIEGKKQFINSVFRIGIVIVLIASVFISIGIWLFRDIFISTFFNEYTATWAFITIIILIPLTSLRHFLAYCYRGMKRVTSEIILNQLSFPLIVILGMGTGIIVGIPLEINTLFKIILIAVILPVLWVFTEQGINLITSFRWSLDKAIGKKMFAYTFPVWGNSILTIGLTQIDRIFIGAFSTKVELGYYSAAYAIAILISFVMHSFAPVSQPLMSEAYSDRNFNLIEELYRTIVDWSSLLVIPIIGGIILFGQPVLVFVFGEQFEAAYYILCVLAVAESINALSGPAGNILLMTNRQNISVYSLFIGFVCGIFLNLLLIPMYGAFGAALGTGFSVSLINLIRIYQIRNELKITMKYNNTVRIVFLVIVAMGIAWIGKLIISYWILEGLLYIACILLGYGGMFKLDLLKIKSD